MNLLKVSLVFASLSFYSTIGFAEGLFGLGIGNLPEYRGSKDNQTLPIGVLNLSNSSVFTEIQGPEIYLSTNRKKFIDLGIVASFDFGREENADLSGQGVSELSFTYDIGPALQFNLPTFKFSDEDRFILRLYHQRKSDDFSSQGVNRIITRYFTKILFLLRTEFEFEYAFANQDYLDFYYGVNASDAGRFGFSQYRPSGSGTHLMAFSQNIIFSFSESTGVFFRYSRIRLGSRPADSPYVRNSGSRNQNFYALAFFYRWN